MFNTVIGSFNVREVFMRADEPESSDEGLPTAVALWTDAPVNSPLAKKFMNNLCKGEKGIGEIIEVQVFDSKVLLEMTDDVTTESQAKKIANSFLSALQTSTNQFDKFDVAHWRYATGEHYSKIDQDFNANNMAGHDSGYSIDSGYSTA